MWGAIGSAAASGMVDVGGSYLSNYVNQGFSKDAMGLQYGYASDLADTQMAWETQMADSQYQRGVADMKAAGLNPMMMGLKGMPPAPTPGGGGGSASAVTPPAGMRLGSSALDFLKLHNDMAQTSSNIGLNQALGAKAMQDAVTSGSSAKLTDIQAENLRNQVKANAAAAKYQENFSNLQNKMLIPDAILNRANSLSNTGKNIMNMFKGYPMGLNPGEILMNGNTGEILKEGRP